MDSLLLFSADEPSVYTVSELNAQIRGLIEPNFPFVWVQGEISNLRTPGSGHHYFTLKDAKSQIRAVMFRSQQQGLRFLPESGLQVLCQGRLSVYEPRGEYQIIVERMEPQGAGALQLAFEQLKRKLDKEGLFASERKRPLPACPQRISIVTSPTGAAVRDMLKVFQRCPFSLSITIFPARVQGREAAAEIAAAIAQANRHAETLGTDLIITGRGGGSIEDLWPFNEEVVARAVAASHLPVISAVGHEIDFTISDMVADMRALTPTAAAEWVVATLEALQREMSSYQERLHQAALQKLSSCRQLTLLLSTRLRSPKRLVEDSRLYVDDRSERLHLAFKRYIERLRTSLCHQNEKLRLQNPLKSIRECESYLSVKERELLFHFHNMLDKHRLRLQKYASQLESLNPLAVLSRGYSVTYRLPDRKIIRKHEEVSIGQKIEVQLSDGSLECIVQRSGPAREPSSEGKKRCEQEKG